MALVTTPGAANANSYGTLADLVAYADTRPFVPAWFATATDAVREAAMISAARLLDAGFTWTGTAVDAVQSRAWPRNGMLTRNSFAIPNTSIPADLIAAQCEFALQLGAGDRLADNDPAKLGITSVRAGSVAVSFQAPDVSTLEGAEVMTRLLEAEMAWASRTFPDSVRLLLVPSWYTAATVQRGLLFGAM